MGCEVGLATFIFAFLELLYKLGEWCELARIDQIELVNEVDEVLEAGVQVRLGRQQHNVLEVSVVDVRVHTEETLEDHLDDVHEVLREGHSQGAREYFLVVQLVLYPGHQEFDVFAGAYF